MMKVKDRLLYQHGGLCHKAGPAEGRGFIFQYLSPTAKTGQKFNDARGSYIISVANHAEDAVAVLQVEIRPVTGQLPVDQADQQLCQQWTVYIRFKYFHHDMQFAIQM
jgi:hypothetical protein